MDWYEAAGDCEFGFGRGEVSFGTDENDDFRAFICSEDFLDAATRRVLVFEAVCDHSKYVVCFLAAVWFYEFLD